MTSDLNVGTAPAYKPRSQSQPNRGGAPELTNGRRPTLPGDFFRPWLRPWWKKILFCWWHGCHGTIEGWDRRVYWQCRTCGKKSW